MLNRVFSCPIVLLRVFLLTNNASFSVAWSSLKQIKPSPSQRINYFGVGSVALSSSAQSSFSDSSVQSKSPAENYVIHRSDFLGDIYQIRIGDDDDFLAANAVPTFAAAKYKETGIEYNRDRVDTKPRGLEGALQQGPAFVLDSVLSPETCRELIETFESLKFNQYNAGKNFHGALQVVVAPETAHTVGKVLSRHVDVDQVAERRKEMLCATSQGDDSETHDVRLAYAGLNRRWRVYRYAPGEEETFAPHIDAGFPPSGLSEDASNLIWDDSSSFAPDTEVVSRLTLLLYLNDDFVGGETNFYQPNNTAALSGKEPSLIASVRPKEGSCLVFPQGVGEEAVEYARQHWPLHEGSPVFTSSGGRPKYVIRSDVLFATTKEKLPLDSELFQNDHKVRKTFLPRSAPLVDSTFLSHLSSLYNPHMGVENLGAFLYSLIRFTKKRKIVEIGAGYTSLWILQALKDNDDEIQRIKQLSDQDECKLLNIQWSNADEMGNDERTPASLLCIDNCEHQKETATGACAVAKTLGLDSYLNFVQGDAFQMQNYLEPGTIDILWCDFGVGNRMADFLASGAWSSLKPGGLLLCHSTLTNQRTREWLEATRARASEEVTGIPSEEYVELSLLEPYKYFQNSVSIFQKRKAGDEEFNEPIFSEYA